MVERESNSLPSDVRRVRFYYDVVCPYSYLESHVVEAAEDAGEIEVEWLPFELRPAPRPLLEPRGDHLRVDWTQNVYGRAQAMGIEIHLPRYQPRSTLPLAACLWAGEEGRLRAFKHALYEAFFCEGEDIATDRELARAALRAGLDADEAVTAAYSSARFEQIASIRREAAAAGVRGVPTLLDDEGRSHWGMGGLQRLLSGQPLVPRAG
jgi:predicted DsbA family dithiol-disulfide isomerase